jgi:hypothetical protein
MLELSGKSDACAVVREDAPGGSRWCSLLRHAGEHFRT